MSASFTHHIRREIVSLSISNCLISGGSAWWLAKHRESVPVWGEDGLVVDFLATAFALVFIVSLIVMSWTRSKLAHGKVQRMEFRESVWTPALAFLANRNLIVCALILAVIATMVFVPAVVLIFKVLGVTALLPQQFAVFKGIWAGVLSGVMVVPMLCVVGFSERSGR